MAQYIFDYDHVRGYRDPAFNEQLQRALLNAGCVVLRLPGADSTACRLTANVTTTSASARSQIKGMGSPDSEQPITHEQLKGGREVRTKSGCSLLINHECVQAAWSPC